MWAARRRRPALALAASRAASSSAGGGNAYSLRSVLWAPTEKQAPADAATPSHALLVRGGFVRKAGLGVYALLPLGKRVAGKLERVIDDEMRRIGGNKLDLPVLLPVELWKQSGRWHTRGPELMTLADRRGDRYALGPTHEESVTSLVAAHYIARRDRASLRLYQIGRKFRDEIRPRFGLLRAREFVMKDMYSFDVDFPRALETYESVAGAYECILRDRLRLPIAKVEADSGSIGGNLSHEFHVLAPVGEDALLSCASQDCGYAANVEKALGELPPVETEQREPMEDSPRVQELLAQTKNQLGTREFWHTVQKLLQETGGVALKLLQVAGGDEEGENEGGRLPTHVALVFTRHDREANELALKPFFDDGEELVSLSTAKFQEMDLANAANMKLSVFLDESLRHDHTKNPIVKIISEGAKRSADRVESGHFRLAQEGDLCTRCNSGAPLVAKRGIEVGHVFYLGQKYSKPFDVTFTNDKGEKTLMEMGCFGMGVSRLIAAAVEVSHDARGIIWPVAIAPFKVLVMTIGGSKAGGDAMAQAAHSIAADLSASGVLGFSEDVMLDDRWSESPGSKLAESELLGYPYRVVVGKRFASEGLVEVQTRATMEKVFLPPAELVSFFQSLADKGEIIE
jgi:prolyl-tRNA synthetase